MDNIDTILKHTNLRYISADTPGHTRKPWGRGFTYQDQDGNTIEDSLLREWIEGLVIPPAWTEVWISPYKNGHILATGRDDAGRKQYIYHPRWNEMRQQHKFDYLADFARTLPRLREVVDSHLRKHKLSKEKVLATVVTLLETTLIRIGNEQYARNNDSRGLTTLEDEHVHIKGSKVIFDFVGKHGKEHEVILKDKRLAKIIKACQDIPGYELFQYYSEDGTKNVIDSADVNAYLKEITGEDFTAKVFRTWGASILAIKVLCNDMDDNPEIDNHAKYCIECVADSLGNTVAVCRDYYIHPIIFTAYKNGDLRSIYNRFRDSRKKYTLERAEKCLLQLIEDY